MSIRKSDTSRPFRLAAIMVLIVILVGCGSDPKNGPSADELTTALEIDLPRYIDITDFEIEVSENTGTEVSPNVGTRFNGTVELNAPLYEVSEDLLGQSVLTVVAEKDQELEMFGVSRSTKSLDQWDIQFEQLEFSPSVEGLPESDFTDYVIESSPEHEDLVAKAEAIKNEEFETRNILLGSWTGTYYCDGFERGVDWEVVENGESLTVTKRFYPLDAGDALEEGRYLAELTVEGLGVELIPIEWIERPSAFYSMLSSSGTLDKEVGKVEGTVDRESCTEFSITKS